eukprot:5968840-Amphidinium_carterae.1
MEQYEFCGGFALHSTTPTPSESTVSSTISYQQLIKVWTRVKTNKYNTDSNQEDNNNKPIYHGSETNNVIEFSIRPRQLQFRPQCQQ